MITNDQISVINKFFNLAALCREAGISYSVVKNHAAKGGSGLDGDQAFRTFWWREKLEDAFNRYLEELAAAFMSADELNKLIEEFPHVPIDYDPDNLSDDPEAFIKVPEEKPVTANEALVEVSGIKRKVESLSSLDLSGGFSADPSDFMPSESKEEDDDEEDSIISRLPPWEEPDPELEDESLLDIDF